MKFTCKGTIVGFTIVGRGRNGDESPRIQLWREDKAQCGFYQKSTSDIIINRDSCSSLTTLSSGTPATSQCALKSSSQINVQRGDILGIQLPPTNDDDFEVYFTNTGATNYIFQNSQSPSRVELATRSSVSQEEPQLQLEITPGKFNIISRY